MNQETPRVSSASVEELILDEATTTELNTIGRDFDDALISLVQGGQAIDTLVEFEGGVFSLRMVNISSRTVQVSSNLDLDVLMVVFDQKLDAYIQDTGITRFSTSATAEEPSKPNATRYFEASHYRPKAGAPYDPADRSTTATQNEPWEAPASISSELALYSVPRRRHLAESDSSGSKSFLCPNTAMADATHSTWRIWNDRTMKLVHCDLVNFTGTSSSGACAEELGANALHSVDDVCRAPGLMPPRMLLKQRIDVPSTNRFNVESSANLSSSDPRLSSINTKLETTTDITLTLHFSYTPWISALESDFTERAAVGGDRILKSSNATFFAGAPLYRGVNVATQSDEEALKKNIKTTTPPSLRKIIENRGMLPAPPPHSHLVVELRANYNATIEFLAREGALKSGAWADIAAMGESAFEDAFEPQTLSFKLSTGDGTTAGDNIVLEPGVGLTLRADVRLVATYDTTTALPWRSSRQVLRGYRMSVTSTSHQREALSASDQNQMLIRIVVTLSSRELQIISVDSYTFADFLSAFGSAVAILGAGASVYVLIMKAEEAFGILDKAGLDHAITEVADKSFLSEPGAPSPQGHAKVHPVQPEEESQGKAPGAV